MSPVSETRVHLDLDRPKRIVLQSNVPYLTVVGFQNFFDVVSERYGNDESSSLGVVVTVLPFVDPVGVLEY